MSLATQSLPTLGFVGVGRMGGPMTERLQMAAQVPDRDAVDLP